MWCVRRHQKDRTVRQEDAETRFGWVCGCGATDLQCWHHDDPVLVHQGRLRGETGQAPPIPTRMTLNWAQLMAPLSPCGWFWAGTDRHEPLR